MCVCVCVFLWTCVPVYEYVHIMYINGQRLQATIGPLQTLQDNFAKYPPDRGRLGNQDRRMIAEDDSRVDVLDARVGPSLLW